MYFWIDSFCSLRKNANVILVERPSSNEPSLLVSHSEALGENPLTSFFGNGKETFPRIESQRKKILKIGMDLLRTKYFPPSLILFWTKLLRSKNCPDNNYGIILSVKNVEVSFHVFQRPHLASPFPITTETCKTLISFSPGDSIRLNHLWSLTAVLCIKT